METAAPYLVFFAMILGPLSFLIAIIGLFRPTWVIWNPSLQTPIKAFFFWLIASTFFSVGGILFAGGIADYYTDDYRNYFVGSKGANVRECPEVTCKIIDTFPANEEVRLAYPSLADLPDWVEVAVEDKYTGQKKTGYVSKTTLSSGISSVAPALPTTGESGIFLGTGDFDPLIIGYSYEFSFCVPDSARSGATCGGLADAAKSPVGGSPPYSFVKGSGFFPPGMALELNGLLSGSPTTVGTYNFKICAKDLKMNQGCENYRLVVIEEEKETEIVPSVSSSQQPAVVESSDYGSTIDSATCSAVPSNNPYDPYLRKTIRASGSAWGSVGATFYTNGDMLTCDTWLLVETANSQYCNRRAGDPEKITWTDGYFSAGSTNNTFVLYTTSGCCYEGTRIVKDNPSKKNNIIDQPCS